MNTKTLLLQKILSSFENTKPFRSSKNTKLVCSSQNTETFLFFQITKNSLFLIQKHTPREASTRQRTEMSIEMEALNPSPERTDASPPLGRVGAPRVSRVMN